MTVGDSDHLALTIPVPATRVKEFFWLYALWLDEAEPIMTHLATEAMTHRQAPNDDGHYLDVSLLVAGERTQDFYLLYALWLDEYEPIMTHLHPPGRGGAGMTH